MKRNISLAISARGLVSSFVAVILLLGISARLSWSQAASQSTADVQPTAAPETAKSLNGADNSNAVPDRDSEPAPSRGFGLPDSFKNRWIGQVSAGVSHDSGITNSAVENGVPSSASYYGTGLSLAYDLPTKRSDYIFQYGIGARDYWGHSPLDSLTQDLGLSQHARLGKRASWNLNYRFSESPDYSGTLLVESLSQQEALLNPAPAAPGVSIQPAQSPADGLVTLRSTRLSNTIDATLSYTLTSRSQFFLGTSYGRSRFEDPNLFGSDVYAASAGVSYQIDATTAASLSYDGDMTRVAGIDFRTLSQGVSLGISKRLGRRTVLSMAGGPSVLRTRSAGEAIPVSNLVGSFLGTNLVQPTASSRTVSWMGTAALGTNIHNTGVNLSYARSVAGLGGLPGTALSQVATVTLSKVINRRTVINSGMSYNHSQLLGVLNSAGIDQEGFEADLSRTLTRNIDMTMFYVYSRNSHGLHGPAIANRNSVGVSVVYNFRRLPFPSWGA